MVPVMSGDMDGQDIWYDPSGLDADCPGIVARRDLDTGHALLGSATPQEDGSPNGCPIRQLSSPFPVFECRRTPESREETFHDSEEGSLAIVPHLIAS